MNEQLENRAALLEGKGRLLAELKRWAGRVNSLSFHPRFDALEACLRSQVGVYEEVRLLPQTQLRTMAVRPSNPPILVSKRGNGPRFVRGPTVWAGPIAVALLVTCLVMGGSGVASASPSATGILTWAPPYSGVVHHTDKSSAHACGDANDLGANFLKSTGNLTGGGDASAHSCKKAGYSTSEIAAGAYIILPDFTGYHGHELIQAKWKFTFLIEASLSGTCTSAGDFNFSSADITFTLSVLNLSSGKPFMVTSKGYFETVDTAMTNTSSVSTTVTLSEIIKLDGKDRYSIVTGASFSLGVQVMNPPSAGKSASCTAAAEVLPSGGSPLGLLLAASVG